MVSLHRPSSLYRRLDTTDCFRRPDFRDIHVPPRDSSFPSAQPGTWAEYASTSYPPVGYYHRISGPKHNKKWSKIIFNTTHKSSDIVALTRSHPVKKKSSLTEIHFTWDPCYDEDDLTCLSALILTPSIGKITEHCQFTAFSTTINALMGEKNDAKDLDISMAAATTDDQPWLKKTSRKWKLQVTGLLICWFVYCHTKEHAGLYLQTISPVPYLG